MRPKPKPIQTIYLLALLVCAAIAGLPNTTLAQNKAEWQSRVESTFTVVSGNLATASRIAVLATDDIPIGEDPSPGFYGALLSLPLKPQTSDPELESQRVKAALNLLRFHGVEVDVWTQGFAGLVVRRALDSVADPSFVRCVVLVDVPNRGISPSGWPDWRERDAGTPAPRWAISGSKFLLALNSKTATQVANLRVVNVWRRGSQFMSRATVMQLPRAAVDLVIDAPAGPLLQLLNLPVSAGRQVGVGGPEPRRVVSAFGEKFDEARTYAAHPVKEKAPLFEELLNQEQTLAPESLTSWAEYQSFRAPQSADRLIRMTDVLGARWSPVHRSLIVVGYEDYFRDPLRTDILLAAIDAYKKQQPAISIDPHRPGDPPNQAPVRYESGIAGSRLGGLMFEADRIAKILSLARDNITETELGSGVSNFNPIAGRDSEHYGSTDTVWRLWFEPERWHSFEPDRYSTVLDAKFHINWQKMSEGYAPSQRVREFVDSLNRNFAEYSQEQPALAQLDGSARLIALANWLVEAKLDLKGPGEQRSFHTPDYTPLIEVSATGEFGRFKVTQVIQGGVVAGIRVRHIREPAPSVDAVLKRALAAIYPPALANPPPVSTRGRAPRDHIPTTSARPPPATAGFVVDNVLLQAAAFGALPLGPMPGIASASDKPTDPPTTIDDIIRARALAPQILTASVDDAEGPPVLILKGSRFGKNSGQVVFNEKPVRILAWSDTIVLVAAPSSLTSGQILLRSGSGESNPIELTVIPGAPHPEPAPVKFENATTFPISVWMEPDVFGSYRAFTLQPGDRVTTKVVPGSYKVLGFPADGNVIVSQNQSTKQFNSGYEYSIRFEPRDFPVGKITIQNNSGGTLSVTLRGPVSRNLTIGPGTTTLQVTPGIYHLEVGLNCGQLTKELNINSGDQEILTYQCIRR